MDQKRHGESFLAAGPKKDPLITELPDIDDGGFQQLRQNDKVIVSISTTTIHLINFTLVGRRFESNIFWCRQLERNSH